MNRTFQSRSAVIPLLALLAVLAACQPSPTQPIPADFHIALERGPCFGTCPVYSLSVSADGSVVYDGKQFVAVEGQQIASLSAQQVQELAEAVVSADFFALEETYTVPATDLPSITTTVKMQGRTKSIYHYGVGCGTDLDTAPPGLCALEALLESIPVSNGWVSDRS